MKTKTILILLGCACALMAFIRFYDNRQLPTREAADRDQYVLNFDRNNIDGIVITTNDEKIELRKRGSIWQLEAPVKDRADQNAVTEILSKCELLHKDASLEGTGAAADKLKEFGVDKSSFRLKLLGNDAPPELLFGKETAVEGKTYVRLDGSHDACVVSNELRKLIFRKADALRDHHLSQINPAELTQITFKTAAGEIQISKNRDRWGLDRPLKARTNDKTVGDLIDTLLGMEIVSFVPNQGANLDAFGLSDPRETVTFYTSSDEKPFTLDIGAKDEKTENLYARISTRADVFLLPKRLEKLLAMKPDGLRDRSLVRLDLDIVDRFTIEPATQPKIFFQRRKEDWVFGDSPATAYKAGKAANADKIASFVRMLQTRPVSAFVADVASDLSKYGLDHPQLRVAFSSYSSENTAESTAGERPFASVAFGNVEGDNVYARVEQEPFIVSVSKSTLDEINLDPACWRALAVFQINPDQIRAINVKYNAASDLPPAALLRDRKGWKTADGTPIGSLQNINAQSLVNTLATLSAMRWVASAPDGAKANDLASGLGIVSETILFKTADGTARTLLLGPAAADNTCQAMLEGDPAIFVVSGPDESALRLPLTQTGPTPASAPASQPSL